MRRNRRVHAGLFRLLVAGLLGTSLSILVNGALAPARADVFVDSTPAPSWRVNGTVYATKIVGDTVFVGGSFSTATSPNGQSATRRNLAAFSMSTGALLNWRADAGSAVRAIESDGTSIYVGGSFGQVDGVTRRRMAKINVTSGAVDPNFRPNFNDNIRAIELDATAVYVGGNFTTVDGITRQRIVKLSHSGTVDTRFNARANNYVWAIAKAPSSSSVYVAGRFTTLNGTTRNGVGALDTTTGATTSRTFGNAVSPTLSLAVNEDGSRLFGGGGTWRNAVSAWNTSTGTRIWTHMAGGDIQAVAYYQGTVYFGFHDGYGGDTRLKVLAADAGNGALDAGFRPRFNRFWGVMAIDASSRGVVVGGDFTTVSGVAAQGWARFPGTGGLAATTPPPPTSGDVLTIQASDDATVQQAEPQVNAGDAARLQVDRSPVVMDALLRFEVSGTAGRQVERAVLRVHTLDRSDRGGSVAPIGTNWNEQTVTWASAPSAGAPVGVLPTVEAGNWYEVDVTRLVSGDGPVALRITPNSWNGADYASSESNGLGPVLDVTLAGE